MIVLSNTLRIERIISFSWTLPTNFTSFLLTAIFLWSLPQKLRLTSLPRKNKTISNSLEIVVHCYVSTQTICSRSSKKSNKWSLSNLTKHNFFFSKFYLSTNAQWAKSTVLQIFGLSIAKLKKNINRSMGTCAWTRVSPKIQIWLIYRPILRNVISIKILTQT